MGFLDKKEKSVPLESSSSKEGGSSAASMTEPPPYSRDAPVNELPPDLSQRLQYLSLSWSTPNSLPPPDLLIAHLKLLESIYNLRLSIGNQDGLFDIARARGELANDPATKARVSEKRWAVYVARAADRFEKWWFNSVPNVRRSTVNAHLTCKDWLTNKANPDIVPQSQPLAEFTKDTLPPLDVLMVWHAYTLNPRCFFEDCFRYGMISTYALGIPWDKIDAAISSTDFEYSPSQASRDHFEKTTGLSWDNLQDDPAKTIQCPSCRNHVQAMWTAGSGFVSDDKDFVSGIGYADSDFTVICKFCSFAITHDVLRALKFRNDVEKLQNEDLPLPGTVLNTKGQPPKPTTSLTTVPVCYFPNMLVQAGLAKSILAATECNAGDPEPSMTTIKEIFEKGIKNKSLVSAAKTFNGKILRGEKVSIRRVMSRYWFNSSQFSLDLVGAVIRQGTFIEKMHNIDWLHSPALMSTMERCVKKYDRFFKIMARYPTKVAVPTLDVDLAWHTHQTNPKSYYVYSDDTTTTFIDHDDKIEESKLSTFFTWTSKVYQDKYGEPYSECTCWYCEATRESHTSSVSRFLGGNNARASKNLHQSMKIPSDPMKSPHISTHNAVRDHDSSTKARVHAAQLDKGYHQACTRARKEGRPVPQRDQYFYAYAWGYPIMYPYGLYYPYGIDPCISGGGAVYAANPCGVDSSTGAYGACAPGTCAGMAASGACMAAGVAGCGSMGGCAAAGVGCGGGGGGVGGCGGGGGGACGGGGGGGCGGGGG